MSEIKALFSGLSYKGTPFHGLADFQGKCLHLTIQEMYKLNPGIKQLFFGYLFVIQGVDELTLWWFMAKYADFVILDTDLLWKGKIP